MHPDTRKALDAIDRACREADPACPAALDQELLRDIDRVAALPCNQNGSDKSWVREPLRESERHWRESVRVR